MKHQCHCHLHEHFQSAKTKKLGLIGIILIGLHILFHVVECLIVPAILMAASSAAQESASAEPATATYAESE